MEKCENCGRTIGQLETPQLIDNHIVCAECAARLASGRPVPLIYNQQQQVPPQRPGVSVLGAFSLVLGVMSLSCAWIPFCGIGQWPLALIGLILGIVGAVVATDGRTGAGIPIAGILICVIALVLPLLVFLGVITMGARAKTLPPTTTTSQPAQSP